jgi:hypothetical protein
MLRIESTPEEDRDAINLIIRELEHYDTHPTQVPELFIPQDVLRRVIQLVRYPSNL